MTENKRFMVDDAGTLIDMETRNMYELAYEVVDLLNALHEENTRLLKANMELTEENTNILHLIRTTYNNERTSIGRNTIKQLMEAIQK